MIVKSSLKSVNSFSFSIDKEEVDIKNFSNSSQITIEKTPVFDFSLNKFSDYLVAQLVLKKNST